MFWGGAAYNNGILPFKHYILGEAYTREGEPAHRSRARSKPDADMARRTASCRKLYPLPALGDRAAGRHLPRVRARRPQHRQPVPGDRPAERRPAQLQRLDEPGRPDFRQSNRGPGTGARIAVPVLNITKTRLNDPHMWFLGTNDQPGDYRSSGCARCHVVYANDRDPRHSGPYAQFGHDGHDADRRPDDPARTSRGIRSSTSSRARSRPASAWSATCTSRTCS